jgi:hypothetical protein
MAKCDGCGASILFGGVREGHLRFCKQNCRQHNAHVVEIHEVAAEISDDQLQSPLLEVFEGPCPQCGGTGPIDIHTSHSVWSALVTTSWKSTPRLSCHGCGAKAKLWGIAFSSAFGWWGFPWGLILTPIQVGRNLLGLMTFEKLQPSDQLSQHVRLLLASQIVQHRLHQQASDQEFQTHGPLLEEHR